MGKPKTESGAECIVKDLISDPKDRIKLDDYVTGVLRKVLESVTAETFWKPLPDQSADGIQQRLTQYENIVNDLLTAVILLGRWGQPAHVITLEKIFLRLAGANKPTGGVAVWQTMRWYPICLLMYAAGIAALSARNWSMLEYLFRTWLISPTSANGRDVLFFRVLSEMNELDSSFKSLPSRTQNRVPRSEYLFDILRPTLDRILFLGESYERLFDEFEVASALVYADVHFRERERVWAKPGRFGYKLGSPGSPIQIFIADAESAGEDMPLLKLGLFDSSAKRFQAIAKDYLALLSRIHWH